MGTTGCAYYNTLFNAKKSYQEATKAFQESIDKTKVPASAQKKYEITIEKCWKLIELFSDKNKYADDALLYICKSEFMIQKYTQAKLHLEQFFGKYPKSNLLPEAYLWYAKLLLKNENLEEANKYFLRVINNSGNKKLQSQASFELGLYAFEKEDYDQAFKYLLRSLKYDLKDEFRALLHYHLGDIYLIQQKYKTAIKHFKKVEDSSPSPHIEYEAKLKLAMTYTTLEKFADSHKILKKMLPATRFRNYIPTIKTTIARNYLRQEKLEDAIEIYKEVVKERKSNPGTAQAAFDLGRIYENVYNNLDSAVVYYGDVEKLYSRFDSVKIAQNKRIFLAEFKKIKNQLKSDERLSYRLSNDPGFRDSLYQAQHRDSLVKIGQLKVEESSVSNITSAQASDASKKTPNRLGEKPAAPYDPRSSRKTSGERGNFSPISEPSEKSSRRLIEEGPSSVSLSADKQKVALEKRKLPEIEFDLMNNHFKLAEFFLLKIENFDSAAYYLNRFLEVYEDSLLTPKAIYALIYVYSFSGYHDPEKIKSLEVLLLRNYGSSQYAKEILKKRKQHQQKGRAGSREKSRKLFLEAESLFFSGKTREALEGYRRVAAIDTAWDISAKAQFAIAWIYEHQLQEGDSALVAYQKIIKRYPTAKAYLKIAQQKIAPPSQTIDKEPDTKKITPKKSDATTKKSFLKINPEDILKEKIRWRMRRDRLKE